MNLEDEPLRSAEEFEAALRSLHEVGDRLLFEESFDLWKSSCLKSWAFGLSDVNDSDAFRTLLHDRFEHLEFVSQRFYRMDYEALVSAILRQADVDVVWTLDRIRGSCEPLVLNLNWSRHETVTDGSSTWSLQASAQLSLGIFERPLFGGFTRPFGNQGQFWLECDARLFREETDPEQGPLDDASFRASEVRKLRQAFKAETDSSDVEHNTTPPELTILNAEAILEDWGANESRCPALIAVAADWARDQLRKCPPSLMPNTWPGVEKPSTNHEFQDFLSESVQLAADELYRLDRLLQAQPDLHLGSVSESSPAGSTINAYLRFSANDTIGFVHNISTGTLTLDGSFGFLQFSAVLPPRNHLGGIQGEIEFRLDENGTATLSSDGTHTEEGVLPSGSPRPPKQSCDIALRLPGVSNALRRLLSYELSAATTSSDLFETTWAQRHLIRAGFPDLIVAKPLSELPPFEELPF